MLKELSGWELNIRFSARPSPIEMYLDNLEKVFAEMSKIKNFDKVLADLLKLVLD